MSMGFFKKSVLIMFFGGFSSVHAEVLPIQQIASWFEEKLVEDAQEKGIPGFAAGLIYGGEIVMTKTYGVRSLANRTPVTRDTVFQLGSVSKILASTLMGVLIQKGHLHLDKPLAAYLPEFGYAPDSLKLRHVLTHSTGLPRFGFNNLIEAERHDRDGIFERLGRAQAVCAPGECYDYHNAAYALTDPVIEKVTGKTFEEALNDYVLTPLKMTRTSASYEKLMQQEDRAHPHQKTKGGYIHCSKYRVGYYQVAPAGGGNASLNDMLSLLHALMGHRPDVLSAETLSMMHAPYIAAKDIFEKNPTSVNRFRSSSYGLGFRILDYEGHKIVFHGGWIKGFINIMAFMPDKNIGVVILQNAETSFPWKMAMSLFDKVLGIEGRSWDTRPKLQKIAHKVPQKAPKTKGKTKMRRTKGILSHKTKE